MRQFTLVMLMAATVIPAASLPVAAAAQPRRGVNEARHDMRTEQRDVRKSRRDYDRELQQYRKTNRAVYARGNWNAPFRYQRWNQGARINATYYAPRYYITDPYRYRLRPVSGNLRWVRHYDDVLLVNTRTGRVVEVRRNFFW